jgi:hypothetical protein
MSKPMTVEEAEAILKEFDHDTALLCEHAAFVEALDRETPHLQELERRIAAIPPSATRDLDVQEAVQDALNKRLLAL